VLVSGGTNGAALNSAELYIPSTGIWVTIVDMNFARYGHIASELLNGSVLISSGSLSSAELYSYS
jgi:hypothetical protein